MRIGFFGGSFNPVHISHLAMAEAVTEQFSLDKCVLVVAGDPPHKQISGRVRPDDRLAMACISAEQLDNDKIFISDYELKKDGISYTVETLEYFRSLLPDDEFFLIMGADMLCSFRSWKNPERIASLASLIAVKRPGQEDNSEFASACEALRTQIGARVFTADVEVPDIASTQIRQRVYDAVPISGLVMPGVEEYIYANALYSPSNIHYITLDLQKRLSMKRFRHSISTMREAIYLADLYGADRDRCRTAALIHDCEKIGGQDAIMLAHKYGVEPDEYELSAPGLIHAKLGAHMAQIRYGIKDPVILDAVAYHTTGAPEMTDVAMITYLADCTEAMRTYPDVEALRRATRSSLEEGMLLSFELSERSLAAVGKTVHPRTLAAREWLLRKMDGIKN